MTWISVAVVGGGSLLNAGIQYEVGKKNQKQNEQNRPQAQIPAEIQQNLNQAQQQALQGLPEAQKQQYLDNLHQSTAYGLNQLGTRNAGLAGVAQVNQQLNQGYQNLLSQDSAARMANQDKLYGARQNLADYKQQNFQINQLNPYYEHIASNQALNGALFQNINNGLDMAGSLAINGMKKKSFPTIPSTTNTYNQVSADNSNFNNYNSQFNSSGIIPDGGYDVSNIG